MTVPLREAEVSVRGAVRPDDARAVAGKARLSLETTAVFKKRLVSALERRGWSDVQPTAAAAVGLVVMGQ